MSPLSHFNVYPTDLLHWIMLSGEAPLVTGMKLRLWAVACSEDPVGTLPDDPDQLARWAGVDRETWDANALQTLCGWSAGASGRYEIRRIVEQHKNALLRSKGARKAAKSRWSKRLSTDAAAMRTQCERNASSTSTSSPTSPSPSPSSSKKTTQTAILPGSLKRKPDPRQNPKVLEVWEYYMKMGWRNPALYRLTRDRARLIELRLEDLRKDLGASDEDQVLGLKRAIDMMGASAFHQGENKDGVTYNTLEYVIRSKKQMNTWVSRMGGTG